MGHIDRIDLRADSTGTVELVCERSALEAAEPRARSFVGGDEFGLLVDDLEPNERVALFVESGGRVDADDETGGRERAGDGGNAR